MKNGVSMVFYHEISFLPISAWRPYQITFRLSWRAALAATRPRVPA
jgi:hypothetical protein